MMLAAVDSGADQRNPRIRTAGRASSAWPIKSDAAAATSSAKPMTLTSSLRPNRSGRPRRSISAGRPATPRAEAATEARQNVLRVEPDEPLLIRTWRVKDQMAEAEIDVIANPLDMLVRIG
jgi:hypothetical protein